MSMMMSWSARVVLAMAMHTASAVEICGWVTRVLMGMGVVSGEEEGGPVLVMTMLQVWSTCEQLSS